MVANLNGGNYDLTQGTARGQPRNWVSPAGPYGPGTDNNRRLQAAAAAYFAFAQENQPDLLQRLIIFLRDVSVNPANIQIGGRRKKRRKRRKKYKTFKKSKRKLNRTIRLR